MLERYERGTWSKQVDIWAEYYDRSDVNISTWVEKIIPDYRMGRHDAVEALTAYITMKEQVKVFEDSGFVDELKQVLGMKEKIPLPRFRC